MSAEHKIRMRIREILALQQPGTIVRTPTFGERGIVEKRIKGGFLPLAAMLPLLSMAAPIVAPALGKAASWAMDKITGNGRVKEKRPRALTDYNRFTQAYRKEWNATRGDKPATQFFKDAAVKWAALKAGAGAAGAGHKAAPKRKSAAPKRKAAAPKRRLTGGYENIEE